MKRSMFCVIALAAAASLPSIAAAETPSLSRQAAAQDVAGVLGLEAGDYDVLSAEAAEQVRGTGGLLSLRRLGVHRLGIGVKANVKANVRVRGLVKVKARVSPRVKVRLR